MGSPNGKARREADRAEARMPEPVVTVFVTNAVRTSDGPGPGVKRLPPGEAAALVTSRRAVYGDQPPRGYSDGGICGDSTGATASPTG
jgi:hypothetical protein